MKASKTDHFTGRQNRVAAIAKALGHPARVAIIEHLLKINNCICGDIVNELPLAQPTVSQHLKELRNTGLIKGDFEGKTISYWTEPNTIEELRHYLSYIVDKLAEQKDKCRQTGNRAIK